MQLGQSMPSSPVIVVDAAYGSETNEKKNYSSRARNFSTHGPRVYGPGVLLCQRQDNHLAPQVRNTLDNPFERTLQTATQGRRRRGDCRFVWTEFLVPSITRFSLQDIT